MASQQEKAEAKLAEAKADLADAKENLAEANENLAEAMANLAEAKANLAEAKEQNKDGEVAGFLQLVIAVTQDVAAARGVVKSATDRVIAREANVRQGAHLILFVFYYWMTFFFFQPELFYLW